MFALRGTEYIEFFDEAAKRGENHVPHNHPPSIADFLNGTDELKDLIFFIGGIDPTYSTPHNLFAADLKGLGRDKLDGLNAFQRAKDMALLTTTHYLEDLECRDVNGHLARLLKW